MTRALIKKTACIVLSLSLICGGGLSWIVGSELIRPANHTVQLPPGLAAKLVSIPGQGHAIAGWWADRGSQSPIVLLLHGIRADRSSMAPRAAVLRSKGFSVLLIDFQAHGETLGQAITLGWRESSDVLAALAWLKAQGSRRRIGAISVSLGGASILLGPQPMGFDAIVLEAVYPRIGRAVENRVRRRAG